MEYIQKARKYYFEATAISDEFTTPENVLRFGSARAAYIACAQDIRWQEAVENEKFMERLANMYGQAAVLQELESQHLTLKVIENEARKSRLLLEKILKSTPE